MEVKNVSRDGLSVTGFGWRARMESDLRGTGTKGGQIQSWPSARRTREPSLPGCICVCLLPLEA